MDPNIILNAPPTSVRVLGSDVEIRTGHRIWVMLQKALDAPGINEEQAFALLLTSAYGRDYFKALSSAGEAEAAVDAALSFFNFNEPRRPLTASQKRIASVRAWDWDWDARYAIADFQRYYRIDLTSPETKLHWWRFWALFTALPGESESMRLMSLRTASEEGLTNEQKKAQRERQRAHMLPARSEEEVALNNSLRWGQDV